MLGFGDSRTTIVAIASATSPALRGVVRITGEDAIDVLGGMVDEPIEVAPRPTRISIRLQLSSPLGIVDAVALIWPTARSYTGCPGVEIHTYGSLPILESIVAAAIHAGARPAGPGEFTMRAFLAGRLDLTQAEAVLGVIDATNRQQLNAALTQLAGNVSAPLRSARESLLNLLADLEAGLDFVEEDISFIEDNVLRAGLQSVADLIESTAAKMKTQRRNESFHWIVMRGRPNAGKSSLLNALVNQSVAIVSDQAGTTRDVVWQELSIGNYRVRLADTAGIEDCRDELTTHSQRAAVEIQHLASVVLHCQDAQGISLENDEVAEVNAVVIRVATKCDSISDSNANELRDAGWLLTSAINGSGLSALRNAIEKTLVALPDASDAGVPGTAARCSDTLDRAINALKSAIELLDHQSGHELIAAEIRQSLSAIGEVTGEIYTDDILDRVFSRFCIGK